MAGRVLQCQGCGSANLELVLDLGMSPPSCTMWPVGPAQSDVFYPLELLRCEMCTLVQLSYVVSPTVVFSRSYPYSSGNSPQLTEHFAALAKKVKVTPTDLVVDIGANDGTFLSNLDCMRMAVEPTDQINHIKDELTIKVQEFFSDELALSLRDGHGEAKYIFASNVLAHVADIHDVLEGIRHLLSDDGMLVTENHDLRQIILAGQWDTVYHEHLRYYDYHSLEKLLCMHGLYVYHYERIPTHGGSFRVWATKSKDQYRREDDLLTGSGQDFNRIREDARISRAHLRAALSASRSGGERWAGVGATARATTIINYCGLATDDIEMVYEVPNSEKIGNFIPGTKIPIASESDLFDSAQPDGLLLLSWHLAEYIMPKLRTRGYAGTITVPLPRLRNHRLPLADPRRRS